MRLLRAVIAASMLTGCSAVSPSPPLNTSSDQLAQSEAQNQAAMDAANKAVAVCKAKFDAAPSPLGATLQYWKCGDAALIKMEYVMDSQDIDIWQDEAAQNEAAAAQFDAGSLTPEELSTEINAASAEAATQLKDREISREAEPGY